MPTYEWRCKRGHDFSVFLPIANYRDAQVCACGESARRIISVPRLVTAQPDVHYDSPIDGRPITSMAQRREDLARHGCREYDPEMKKDAERFRKEADAKLDRSVDETVERQIDAMPGTKREKLANELASGVDAKVERRGV